MTIWNQILKNSLIKQKFYLKIFGTDILLHVKFKKFVYLFTEFCMFEIGVEPIQIHCWDDSVAIKVDQTKSHFI